MSASVEEEADAAVLMALNEGSENDTFLDKFRSHARFAKLVKVRSDDAVIDRYASTVFVVVMMERYAVPVVLADSWKKFNLSQLDDIDLALAAVWRKRFVAAKSGGDDKALMTMVNPLERW